MTLEHCNESSILFVIFVLVIIYLNFTFLYSIPFKVCVGEGVCMGCGLGMRVYVPSYKQFIGKIAHKFNRGL